MAAWLTLLFTTILRSTEYHTISCTEKTHFKNQVSTMLIIFTVLLLTFTNYLISLYSLTLKMH